MDCTPRHVDVESRMAVEIQPPCHTSPECVAGAHDYELDLALHDDVIPEQSRFEVLGTKIGEGCGSKIVWREVGLYPSPICHE
jgi:hypothetical protein